MPTWLDDDGVVATYQMEDGSTLQVPSDVAKRVAPGLGPPPAPPPVPPIASGPPPAVGGAPAPLPAFPAPGAGPVPPALPVAGVADGTLDPFAAAPPPPAAPALLTPEEAASLPPLNPAQQRDLEVKQNAQRAPKAAAPASRPQPAGVYGDIVQLGEGAADLREQALVEGADASQREADAVRDLLATRNAELEETRKKQIADLERVNTELDGRQQRLDAAINDYGSSKVDRNRRFNNLSGGNKALLILLQGIAAVGAAMNGKNQNPALDLWLAETDKDVQQQLADRDQKRDLITQQRGAIDNFRDLASTRQGLYNAQMAAETDKAAKELERIAAQTKSETVKADALAGVAALREKRAEFLGNWRKEEFGAGMQRESLAEQKRSNRVQEGQGWARINQAERQFNTSTALRLTELDNEAAKLEAAGKVDAAKAAREAAKEERELAIGDFTGKPLLQKDGTVYKSPDTHEAAKLRKQVTAGAEAVRIIDSIKRLREDKGAEWFKTDAARQLKGDLSALQLEIKNTAELGVLAGPDMGLIENYLGTGDATELDAFGSIEKGLDQARTNLIAKTRRSLRTAGHTGEWQPPDWSKLGAPQTTAEQKQAQGVLGTAKGYSPGLVNEPSQEDRKLAARLGPEQGARYLQRKQGGYSEDQEKTIDAFAATLSNPNSTEQAKAFARRSLENASKNSSVEGLRKLAGDALTAIDKGTYQPVRPLVFR
jgi:hypothetical protein